MVTGFLLTMTPWLIRNYQAAGGLVLDNPISQTMTMARRWSGDTGNEILERLPGENVAQYSSRLTKMAVRDLMENPRFVLGTAANHFVNSEIASLLAFPARDQLSAPSELLSPQRAFWKTPLVRAQVPSLVFYVFLFSLGLAAAWHYHKLLGLLPLGLGLLYNAWTALFLSSGERFVVPVDWSVHLYELFGLLLLGALALSFTRGGYETISAWLRMPTPRPSVTDRPAFSRRYFALSLAGVIVLSLFLPVTEFIFPQKYPPKSQPELTQEIGMPAQQGEIALYGRAVYPRYYDAGDGEPGTAKLGYGKEEKARLVFFLIGPESSLVIFELEKPPPFFPHTSDVYMIGTQTGGYFSPRVVKVMNGSQTQLYRNK
jgi:hypothetical protein